MRRRLCQKGTVLAGGGGSTGLLYRRNREYTPETSQVTQQDPIGIAGGLSVYGYAGGDPVNRRDPSGLSADSVTVEGSAATSAWNACKSNIDYYANFQHVDTSSTVHLRIRDAHSSEVLSNCPSALYGAGCFVPGPGLSGSVLVNSFATDFDTGLGRVVGAAGFVSSRVMVYRFVWAHEMGHAYFHSLGRSCNEECAAAVASVLARWIAP
jgi:hypothetical protein